MNSTKFEPLPNDEGWIRLLRMHPSQSYYQPIVCTVERHSLSDKPNYVALSYAWGSAKFDTIVTVEEGSDDSLTITGGGQPFHITSNLYAALQMFREIGSSREAKDGSGCRRKEPPSMPYKFI
jgi:hypothetical protein